MCVLIVKNKGVKMPSQNILAACASANPHGFGIATPNGVFKTLNVDEFLSVCEKITPDTPAIIHCRYATHGSIKTENCHPFECKDWIFAHNGVLDITPKNDMTDSETAFLQIFLPLILVNGIANRNVRKVIEFVRGYGSKFAFMNKKTAKIYTFGEFTDIKGAKFSNTRWQSRMTESRPLGLYFSKADRSYYRSEAFYTQMFAAAPF